ncbi:ATP-binding cassette domain-containing protein [Desulfonatronospira sp.]|uniref:ABC transporter ATP-binding protein n=1 Tax=Desulfonatronospira sp. TaxID=1962951 RepID=UPI0025C513A0|nr:ATP-binding cassette domain-containing protein [Desulfonatronospira sp.]
MTCSHINSGPAAVELRQIHKSFSLGLLNTKKKRILNGVSLCVEPGQLVGLSGPSGSGKTTIGNIALGLSRADSGRVLWNGRELNYLPRKEKKRLRPRFQKIFQDPALSFAPFQTLEKSFRDVLRFLFLDKMQAEKRLSMLMQEMKLEQNILKRPPGKVSGGEIQRLALIRCILAEPFFLVADEPTSRLDPLVQAQVARQIQTMAAEKGMGVLFISHDFSLLKVLCHKVLRLENTSLIPAWQTE